MSETIPWLIPIAPLIASLICILMAVSRKGRELAHVPVWIALATSAAASLICLSRVKVDGIDGNYGTIVFGYNWLEVAKVQFDLTLQLDVISLVQICVVTFVSALVAVYARGYMHGDPGYARFFAVFSAFVASMSMLVLADNLLVLYAFWEGVGVCSYLLIGFWFKRPAAAKAATKAFLVNRIADTGFLFGILLLWYAVGSVTETSQGAIERLDYLVIFNSLEFIQIKHPDLLVLIAFLLLVGAIGKSAQFPFHVWLPDAMEGPTPVSALIHAATMVTAGVYLMCRMSPLLVYAPDVLMLAAWLGGITALLAALIALFQHDLKRVLAYSTVSQLGYMFMAIGCGADKNLMSAAVMAALFHVATHAFFKALLFLGAGNVMHAMGDEIDMRNFSGLRRILPMTHLLFAIGAAALAGLPLLAGFWSKDGILSLLTEMSHDEARGGSFTVLLGVGYLTALLTAIYTFRAFLRTFYGDEVVPESAGSHAHEAPAVMTVPLVVLALGSVSLGLILAPTGMLAGYLQNIDFLTPLKNESHGWAVPVISACLCFAGFAVAWMTTRSAAVLRLGVAGDAIANTCENRFYLDEIYSFGIVRPLEWIAARLAAADIFFVDGFWKGITGIPQIAGKIFARMQSGLVSSYAGWMTFGLITLLVVALWA
jgi:NADH-quinone oxidoreductase subunit L